MKNMVEPQTSVDENEDYTTGDAALDNPRCQDGIGETELLVVSFGTSFNDNRRLTIGAIEEAMEAAFPDWSVRRGFTAQSILDRIRRRDGVVIDNVTQALERAVDNGVKTLIVQPTHLMDGLEYNDVVSETDRYAAAFDKIAIGAPLLASDEDFRIVARTMVDATSGYDDGRTAICLLGHGSKAESNAVYAKMQRVLTDSGHVNYFVGTVEANPSLDTVLELVRAGDYKRVVLQPMMIVAGDHANHDMAGDGEGSWKTAFEGAGYSVECVLKGLGEYEEIQRLLVDHARDAMEQSGEDRKADRSVGRLDPKADSQDLFVFAGGKRLRCGYTTGTCAALAAQGAAYLLLTGNIPVSASLTTPKGPKVAVSLENCRMEGGAALCSVRKDGGDDVDATDGLRITAQVERQDTPGISIEGGTGVGRVTRPGLDQPVGAAAINRVPRQMIARAVQAVVDELDEEGGFRVTIHVPEGAEAAKRTFNPQMGVEGGISILGTSGIVEPMSAQALIDTIALEIRQKAAQGYRSIILTPGNYGMDFLRAQGMDRWGVPAVKCSNYIGDALDACAAESFQGVLLVGHIGKLGKLAGGIMNTHSRFADCRTELFCAHAALCGAGLEVCRSLMDCTASDACIAVLDHAGLRRAVLDRMLEAVQRHLDRRVAGAFPVGAVLFSNQYGLLGRTWRAKELMDTWSVYR